MTTFWLVALSFGLLVLVFNAVWSLIAVRRHYSYLKGFWVSFLIYAGAGLVIGRSAGAVTAGLVGAIVATVEATLGSVLAQRLGAYTDAVTTQIQQNFTAVVLTQLVVGFVFGGLGGLAARLW